MKNFASKISRFQKTIRGKFEKNLIKIRKNYSKIKINVEKWVRDVLKDEKKIKENN